MSTAVALSKVFILDKYFTELQKFWETEKKLKEIDKTNSNASSIVMPFNQRGNEITSEIHDLIHLSGPLTEDSVLRTLNARFINKDYFTNIGPVLLSINSYQNIGNPLTLSSTHQEASRYPQLLRVVNEAVRQQTEIGYPQAIILSGESGSGKTYSSMLLLRHLFDVSGGGPETDSFKHLSAAFTVLRSLGSARTSKNSESSRIGHFIEVQVTDGALYRTKIHSYFLDQTRVVKQSVNEKNYHIFYQLLAGLTEEERAKLNLDGYTTHNLKYLNRGDLNQNEQEDASRFEAWRSCLSVLGIPFMDVMRVLAAILLLGNIQLNNDTANNNNNNNNNTNCNNSSSVTTDTCITSTELKGNNEIKSVSSLLGISSSSLYTGLTTRSLNVRGQLVKSLCDGYMSSNTRDALAKALYCRTVATIVRRANSLKRMGTSCGTLSSDSNESVHNNLETASHKASTVGSCGAKSYKSMKALNSAVRHATDGFIGILDMFGFEDLSPSHLEQLCINLSAETMQHFYNTHIFKSSTESCREEGIQTEIEIDYADNVACIDLISSLRTGLLSMLDAECSMRGTSESYIQNIRNQHCNNCRFIDTTNCKIKFKNDQISFDKTNQSPSVNAKHYFGIRHFAGNVYYDTISFISANRDVVPDDIISIFHKSTCTFGFATHLFGTELKSLYARDVGPQGILFRISPTSHTDLNNGTDPISTLTQDFHTRLDNLLRTLVHAKPHFIRCIKANNNEKPNRFDRGVVIRQLRALQVLETVNLMAGGLPHRIRFRAFNSRYRCLAPFKKLKRVDEKAMDDCKLLLDCFAEATENIRSITSASTSWAIGKRHVFLSEGVRQQLELLRTAKRNSAASLIQKVWREWHFRKRWPTMKKSLLIHKQAIKTSNILSTSSLKKSTLLSSSASLGTLNRPRPQPITGTPPPEICDQKIIQQTCTLFGLDLEHPPPVPPSRSYTVAGNTKLGYPQARVMKMDFPENDEIQLEKGETVTVIGTSTKRGHLLVEKNNITLQVPYQYLELLSGSAGSNGTSSVPGLNI